MRVVSLLTIAVPLAQSRGEFFKFSSFAVDKLYNEGLVNSGGPERRSLRFETCVLHSVWMTATLSRTVVDDSASVPWRLTSVTCGADTHVDPTPLSVEGFSCPELVSAAESLNAVSADTVRTCYGLATHWSLEENPDLFSALVSGQQLSILSHGDSASITAFALVHARRPEPAQVACDTEASCVVSRSGESVTITRSPAGNVKAKKFFCAWGSSPFLDLPLYRAGNNSEQLGRLAEAIDVTALCATALDQRQTAKADHTPLLFGAFNEGCVVESGLDATLSVHRRDGRGKWEFNHVTCRNKPIGFKATLAGDPKKAAIMARLEQQMNAKWRDETFNDFERESYFRRDSPDYCHFLRLDQGSGLSFNWLCH